MTTNTPDPNYISLHFRHARSSVLLSVSPTDKISPTIKHQLLVALAARNITRLPNTSTPVPQPPSDPNAKSATEVYDSIDLGVLRDRKDPNLGWLPLMIAEQEIVNSKTGKKGKVGGTGSVLNETPLGAGLKDGDHIAFRIKDSNVDDLEDVLTEYDVQLPSQEEEEADEAMQS